MSNQKFKGGETVYHVSNSEQLMSVVKYRGLSNIDVVCTWITKEGKQENGIFNQDSLVMVLG